MVYGKLPYQHIKNQFQLMHTICDPTKRINFPPIQDEYLLDVLVVSTV